MVEAAVAERPDLTVVGSAHGEVKVLLQAGRFEANVVIVEIAGKEVPAVAERLVDEYRDIGVLAVDTNHKQALLYRLRLGYSWVHELTPAVLAGAIRRAANPHDNITNPCEMEVE
jgi:hypothetical protein